MPSLELFILAAGTSVFLVKASKYSVRFVSDQNVNQHAKPSWAYPPHPYSAVPLQLQVEHEKAAASHNGRAMGLSWIMKPKPKGEIATG